MSCVFSLEHPLARARSVGVTAEEIAEIVELGACVRLRASSYLERFFNTVTEGEQETMWMAQARDTFVHQRAFNEIRKHHED